MIPGMNSRQARQMMRKMGIDEQELEATQVIIKTPNADLVFDNPSVSKVSMSGQVTFQLTGDYEEIVPDASISIDEEDVKTVVEQTGCDEQTAREKLEQHNGDIAAVIMELSENQ